MPEQNQQKPNRPLEFDEHEDTDETSLAGRIPIVRWYLRVTRGFGKSRAFFMPFGFLALTALAFYLGFPALLDLTDLLLRFLHRGLASLGGLFSGAGGGKLGALLDLNARETAAPVIALFWGTAVAVRLAFGALHPPEDEGKLGYVVPGSGIIARTWAVIGRRIHQIRQAVVFLFKYLRDLNLEKIYMPVAVPLLLLLAGVALSQAIENLLFEIPARIEGLRSHTGWIPLCSRISAAVVVLVLGIPMLINSVLRVHQKSVRLRVEKKMKIVRRLLTGLLGTLYVLVPLAWMTLQLLAGRLS